MRGQIIATRNQTKEIVRYERQAQIRELLSEVENGIVRVLDAPFSDTDETLGMALTHDSFFDQCSQEGTAESHAIEILMQSAFPYVRLLSELYLLDVGVLDPLSEKYSEEQIIERDTGSSAAAFWLSYKMTDVTRSLVRCRPEDYFVFKLIEASTLIRETDFDKYIEPAAAIKWRYDVYKDQIEITNELFLMNNLPFIRINVVNPLEHPFRNVTVRCVASTESEDLDDRLFRIKNLRPEDGEPFSMMTSFASLRRFVLDTIKLTCTVETAIYSGNNYR